MYKPFTEFWRSECAAVTVDWTVLSAAAVSMSLATVTVLSGGIDGLISRVDNELRTQQMSDSFVEYLSGHFEPLIQEGWMTMEDGEVYFDFADSLMNQEIIDALQLGIEQLEDGTLSQDDLALLVALASVAQQRNVIDDEVLDYYFSFGTDDDPRYMDYY